MKWKVNGGFKGRVWLTHIIQFVNNTAESILKFLKFSSIGFVDHI